MRLSGNLRSWNDERGFGFIKPAQGGKDIFVHIKAFPPGTGRPTIGQVLTFEIEVGPNGKIRAHSVHSQVNHQAPKTPRTASPASVLLDPGGDSGVVWRMAPEKADEESMYRQPQYQNDG